jgi:hypothetical protein
MRIVAHSSHLRGRETMKTSFAQSWPASHRENGSNGKLPENSHYLPENDCIPTGYRPHTDRISSDIDRIILPEKPGLTGVISELFLSKSPE